LAALRALKSTTEKKRWDKNYEQAVRGLLITQLQYVLTGGSNRWEAHEIKNVRVMAVWFLKSAGLDCGIDNRPIRDAAWRYRDDWKIRVGQMASAIKMEGAQTRAPSTH
jgi:hypothetical protein